MFRPSEEIFTELLKAVKDYDGAVVWVIDDDCIGAWKAKPNLTGTVRLTTPVSDEKIRKHNEALRQPPDPEFIEKAVADIPVFCTYLEMRLGLKDREPQQFDPRWLTAEGLAQSKGEFEDFLEADSGSWSVFLARNPVPYGKTSKPTSTDDRGVSIGLGWSQQQDLFRELGANWDGTEATEETPIIPGFPLLSRLSDVTSDAIYEPEEVAGFLEELHRAQQVVKEPRSIRGLDNLIRIARRASRLNVGIHFSGV